MADIVILELTLIAAVEIITICSSDLFHRWRYFSRAIHKVMIGPIWQLLYFVL